MPVGAVIGALRVVIGADSAALEKGLKQAQGSLNSFARAMAAVAGGVGIERAVEKSVNVIVHSIKEAIQYADELGKAAQKVGMPVEELSALKYAADLADVSFETLTKALVKFDKNQADAAANVENDFTKALKAMKLEAQNADGTLKSQTQLIDEIADKFAGYADGAEKTRIANALFNKVGAEMVPLLNQGADGLRKARDEAKDYGLVVSADAAARSEEFNDNLKRLGAQARGVAQVFTNELIKSMSDFSDKAVDSGKAASQNQGLLDKAASFARKLGEQYKIASIELPGFIENIKSAAAANYASATGAADAAEKWKKNADVIYETEKAVAAVNVKYNEFVFTAEMAGGALKKLTEAGAAAKPPAPTLIDTKPIQDFIEQTQRSIEAQNAQGIAAGKNAFQQEYLRVVTEGLTIAEQKKIPVDDALLQKLNETGIAAGNAAMKLQGFQLIQQNLDPNIKYQQEIENTTRAMELAGATADQIGRQQEKLADQFGRSWTAIGGAVAGTFGGISRLMGQFAKDNKALGMAAKAFGIGEAIINTQVGITKAVAQYGMPFAIPFIAMAVAQGAASIAAIASQSFAQGGSFRIPGGISATDNQMVPLNLASGERVDITPASGASSAPASVTIDMRGDDPWYSRAAVERLLNAMHTVIADGHESRLVIVK